MDLILVQNLLESLLPKRRSKRPAEWSVRVRADGYISPEFNFGRKGTEGRQFLSTSPSPYPVNVQGWARNVVPTSGVSHHLVAFPLSVLAPSYEVAFGST